MAQNLFAGSDVARATRSAWAMVGINV
jgi:hypothetical protein